MIRSEENSDGARGYRKRSGWDVEGPFESHYLVSFIEFSRDGESRRNQRAPVGRDQTVCTGVFSIHRRLSFSNSIRCQNPFPPYRQLTFGYHFPVARFDTYTWMTASSASVQCRRLTELLERSPFYFTY